MKNRKYKIIFLSLGGFFLSFSFALAKNFTIYNATNVNLPYFSVNGTSGNVGIGLTNPTTPLQFKNNSWISSLNGAGTGVVNMFKVNANNQIEVGAPLNIGSFEFSPDSGLVSFVDMPVSAAPGNGALQGYAFRIDGNNLMTLYSEANGLGGIKNTGLGIGTAAPGAKLDIVGALRTTSATISLLGNSGNRIVMTDDSGNLYATSSSIASGLPAPIAGNKNFTLRSDGANWIANSLIYNNGTNVGIGTSNPLSRLHINASALNSFTGVGRGVISLETPYSASPSYSAIDFLYSGNNSPVARIAALVTSSGSYLSLGTSNNYATGVTNSAMTIDYSSNVGIGITSPGSLLTVGSNLGFTAGGTIYNSNSTRYLDLSGVKAFSLEVPNAIKFGDTSDACDAAHTGALRYNAISGQSYLCDGTRWLNQKNCGLMTDDAGKSYGTVQIGGQCWMAENIDIGAMIPGASNPSTSDNIIEKYCYGDIPSNCSLYGGLYNWNEAVRGAKVSGARGICPAGWHVPTDAEFNILEKTVLGVIASSNSQFPCDFSVSGWRRCADDSGTDPGGASGVGKSLKGVGLGSGVGLGNDLVGFNAKLSGYRNADSSFNYLGSYLYLWSSSPSGSSSAWYRFLYSSYSTVYRFASSRAYGFSVRCVRD